MFYLRLMPLRPSVTAAFGDSSVALNGPILLQELEYTRRLNAPSVCRVVVPRSFGERMIRHIGDTYQWAAIYYQHHCEGVFNIREVAYRGDSCELVGEDIIGYMRYCVIDEAERAQVSGDAAREMGRIVRVFAPRLAGFRHVHSVTPTQRTVQVSLSVLHMTAFDALRAIADAAERAGQRIWFGVRHYGLYTMSEVRSTYLVPQSAVVIAPQWGRSRTDAFAQVGAVRISASDEVTRAYGMGAGFGAQRRVEVVRSIRARLYWTLREGIASVVEGASPAAAARALIARTSPAAIAEDVSWQWQDYRVRYDLGDVVTLRVGATSQRVTISGLVVRVTDGRAEIEVESDA